MFEGLRGLAALSIVAYHTGSTTGLSFRTTGAGPYLSQTSVAVSVFFVLSAFLLYRPFVVAHLGGAPAPSTRSYLWRRALRIFPAYWLALTIDAHVLHHSHIEGLWDHVRFYGLLQVYWAETGFGGLVQAWTLCVEASFYLFLPAWAWLVGHARGPFGSRVRVQYIGCCLLFVSGVTFRWGLRAGGHALGYSTLPANLDLFAIGMALAVAHTVARQRADGPLARSIASGLGGAPGLCWAAGALLFVAVSNLRLPLGLTDPTALQEIERELLFGVIALLLVAPGVFGPQGHGLLRRMLDSRPLRWLGLVSYGLYLWHLTVMNEVDERLRGGHGAVAPRPPPAYWTLFGWTAVIALLFAVASWLFLERPLIGLGRARRSDALVPGQPDPAGDGSASAPPGAPSSGTGAPTILARALRRRAPPSGPVPPPEDPVSEQAAGQLPDRERGSSAGPQTPHTGNRQKVGE